MKQLFTFLLMCFLSLQSGFGQCDLIVSVTISDPSSGNMADTCWDDEFFYVLSVHDDGNNATSWNYTIDGGELQHGGAFSGSLVSEVLPVFGTDQLLNELEIQVFSASEPACTASITVYAPIPSDCNCLPTMDYNLGTEVDDNGTPNICSDDSLSLSFTNVNANNLETYELLLDNELVHIGIIGDLGGEIRVPANGKYQRLTLRGGDLETYACVNVYEITPPSTEDCICTLGADFNSYVCDDNGTLGDTSDDTFSVYLNVHGTTNGWVTPGGNYFWLGTPILYGFGPYPMADGPYELTIIDENAADCSLSFTFFPSNCYPPSCEMTINQIGEQTFLDNGTPTQCSDDTYVVTLSVSSLWATTAGWRIILDDGSLSPAFPYEEEVLIDFLPTYTDCGKLNTTFTITDALDFSCSQAISLAPPALAPCDCEAFICYTEGAINDNDTPLDCSDDLLGLNIRTEFIAPGGTTYELLLDDVVVHQAEMTSGELTLSVPADGIERHLTLNDETYPTCMTTTEIIAGCTSPTGDFSLSLGNAYGVCAGESICIPLIAQRFTDVLGFQFSINYNPDQLIYTGADNFTSDLFAFSAESIGNPAPGNLTFTWNDPSISGVDLSEGALVCELCFVSAINDETASPLLFSGQPTPVEIVGEEENLITPEFVGGNLSCECFTQSECNLLQGRVLTSNDCLIGENPLADWLIRVRNDHYLQYLYTDTAGNYSVDLPEGSFEVQLFPPAEVWEICEIEGYVVDFANAGEIQNLDLLVQPADDCALLEVDMQVAPLRRCFEDQIITINYENVGTVPLEDGFIGLLLPEQLSYSATNGNYLGTNGDTLLFMPSLPLPLGAEGQFVIYVDVSCDVLLGGTLCVKAISLPYSPCPVPSEEWSGASLQVGGDCTDEEVIFTLRNVGDNSLSNGNTYIIIQDGVMLYEVPEELPPLLPGESTEVNLPANGSTYRLEATQEPFHPGSSHPTAVIEACGTNEDGGVSLGFVSQFPNDDENIFIDEDCRVVTGSYDPNDKQAEPLGYAEQHYIKPEQWLEYTIRFQNTGNDTAFTVVIQDTLSEWLDFSTLRPGVSSHSYELSLDSAQAISFIFNDILLPDSTTNFEASQGFVDYKIRPRTELPLETRIENTASIYFDFNEAIVTNTTYHQLGENFVEIISWVDHQNENANWQVFPNPTSGELTLKNTTYEQRAMLRVFDALGQERSTHQLDSPTQRLNLSLLPTGWYLLQITGEKGELLASAKLIRM